jgi:hypothetical protein
MSGYISEFQGGLQELVVLLKGVAGLQPSSSGGGSGICLYPSQTARQVFGAQTGIYGIIFMDFLFLAFIWPWIRAPILALSKRCTLPATYP